MLTKQQIDKIRGSFIRGNLKVRSVNPITSEVESKTILDVLRHKQKKDFYQVGTKSGREVGGTGDHSLFRLKNGRINPIETRGLNVGSKIVVVDEFGVGEEEVVRMDRVTCPRFTYDLSVKGNENFVLSNGILAHNSYSISAISLDIEKSSKYQSMKDNFESMFERDLENFKRTLLYTRGLQQQRFGIGICISLNTPILYNKFGYIKFGDVLTNRFVNESVLGVSFNCDKFIDGNVCAALLTGKKRLYKVETETGKWVEVSIEHPFFSKIGGWLPLSNLEPGVSVATVEVNGKGPEFNWEKIKRIIPIGIDETGDLLVRNIHSFVANGIVVHNSAHLGPWNKCFTKRNKIQLANGDKTYIGDVVKNKLFGEEVIAFDDKKFRLRKERIENVFSNGIKDVYELRVGGSRLYPTANHPFMTKRGWRQLRFIGDGEILINDNGKFKWKKIDDLIYKGREETFNLTVSNCHSYLVDGIIARNSGIISPRNFCAFGRGYAGQA